MYGRGRIARDRGEGVCVYFGDRRGAPFVAVSLGWAGWCSAPLWMPGGWEYWTPHVHTGRLFTDDGGRWVERRVLVPAKLVHLWRSRRRAYREAGREMPMEAPPEGVKCHAPDGEPCPTPDLCGNLEECCWPR